MNRNETLSRLSAEAPSAEDALVHALVDEMHAAAAGNQAKLWLLIDPTLRDPFEQLVEVNPDLATQRCPIDIAERAVPVERRPYLLPIDLARNASCHALDMAIRMAIEDGEPNNLFRRQGQRLAGVLASHCAKADLARHLGRIALVRLPGGQQSLFRYFDPVVLDLLWPQLDEAQRAHFMGPVARWHLLDREAHWMNLALALTTTGLERGVAALALTPTQLADLKRVTLVNQAAAMASAELGERLPFRKIESALGASAWAETQGLTDAGDQVAMLSVFLMSGMQMLHHPIMTPVWQAVRGGCSWSVATDILTHEDWITVSTS